MGKKTRQQQKAYQLKLNVPDQRHLSYLSDAHAIHSARLIGQNQPVKSFENFLLDCVFKTANEEVKAYTEAIKKQQEAQMTEDAMNKEYEVDDSAIREEQEDAQESTTGELEADTTEERTSEDNSSSGLESGTQHTEDSGE